MRVRHKQEVIIKVKMLRASGLTLDQICKETSLPRTTIYGWIRSVHLTREQQEIIKKNAISTLQAGRIIAQASAKTKKDNLARSLFDNGIAAIGKLSKRELFLVGVALYWAEGFKSSFEHRLGFCNSDPQMILLYLAWLDLIGVTRDKIAARVTVNISYKDRIKDITKYWIERTNIPPTQFTKPFFQQIKWKKQYDNNNYYGVLRIHVNKSMENLLLMRGWIEGLNQNIATEFID